MRNVLILPAILTLSLSAKPSPSYDACIKASGGATMDVVMCMGKEEDRLRALIGKRVAKLRSCLPASRRGEVDALYRAWDEYAQSKCGLFIGDSGGTGDKEDAGECGIDAADDFADELKEFIEIYCVKK